MNIFYTDANQTVAAQDLPDKILIKMVLETAQLLCTAVNLLGGQAKYKTTHKNHPCSIWTRESVGNFIWLSNYGFRLGEEYRYRYKKTHKSEAVIQDCVDQFFKHSLHNEMQKKEFFDPPKCMPTLFTLRNDHVTDCYKDYMITEKSRFAKWEKGREAPSWWKITKK